MWGSRKICPTVHLLSEPPCSPGALYVVQLPAAALALHSLSNSPLVGLVVLDTYPLVGQFEQFLHQCQVSLYVLRLYSIPVLSDRFENSIEHPISILLTSPRRPDPLPEHPDHLVHFGQARQSVDAALPTDLQAGAAQLDIHDLVQVDDPACRVERTVG